MKSVLFTSLALVLAQDGEVCETAPVAHLSHALLQVKNTRTRSVLLPAEGELSTCAELVNHGAYFTVQVSVGTPPQAMDIVADTGSDNVIVRSCVCVDSGKCVSDGPCFRGTNMSSSFALSEPLEAVTITFGSGEVTSVAATDVVQVGSISASLPVLLMTEHSLGIQDDMVGILGLGLPERKDDARRTIGEEDTGSDADIDVNGDLDDIIRQIADAVKEAQAANGGSSVLTQASQTPVALIPFRVNNATGGAETATDRQQAGAGQAIGEKTLHELWDELNKTQAREKELMEAIKDASDQQIASAEKEIATAESAADAVAAMELQEDQERDEAGGGAEPAAEPAPASGLRQGPEGFLQRADVSRFSMCFNDGENGVLRLNSPERANSLGSIGKAHWGLDLRGVSVRPSGAASGSQASTPLLLEQSDATRLDLCTTKGAGQETACGAIPDSGTTLIMMPQDHLEKLHAAVCDAWPRCREAKKLQGVYAGVDAGIDAGRSRAKAGGKSRRSAQAQVYAAMRKFNRTHESKAAMYAELGRPRLEAARRVAKRVEEAAAADPATDADEVTPDDVTPDDIAKIIEGLLDGNEGPGEDEFVNPLESLLEDCGSWLSDDKLHPDGSATGLSELPTLELSMAGPEGTEQILELPGWAYVLEIAIPLAQQELLGAKKTCGSAFGPMEYTTQKNGPVWILGTPVFYSYEVGYSLKSTPPAVSFTAADLSPCGSCASGIDSRTGPSLMEHAPRQKSLRKLTKAPRMPALDLGEPL